VSRLLLDTHVLLWWLDDSHLSPALRKMIADPDNDVAISAASVWEISIKRALNKLSVPDALDVQIAAEGFTPLAITVRHALAAGALPRHHDDPFDRMLVAQAKLEDLTLVTADGRFSAYDVRLQPV
jgi:PIN domain nuclease of toxin-antitoxin system